MAPASKSAPRSKKRLRRPKPTSVERKILVVSGPTLDRLGKREPEIYGTDTLQDVHDACRQAGAQLGASVECRQSNYEGELVTWLSHSGDEGFVGIVLNGGAYTHTSIALYDALRSSGLPAVEVHVSHPPAREPFRHRSRVAPACIGAVTGFGLQSYVLGITGLVGYLGASPSDSDESENATGDKRAPMRL